MLHVLFEDSALIVLNKPAGVPVQSDKTGDTSLIERATREQRQLAAELDGRDSQAGPTGALLRNLLVARGEYGPVVELYERTGGREGATLRDTTIRPAPPRCSWRRPALPGEARRSRPRPPRCSAGPCACAPTTKVR